MQRAVMSSRHGTN